MSDKLTIPFAFPLAMYNSEGCITYNLGMTLLDYFAGQFIVRGDTAQDAYRNAQLMMKEREKYV